MHESMRLLHATLILWYLFFLEKISDLLVQQWIALAVLRYLPFQTVYRVDQVNGYSWFNFSYN